jgi:hypothetical protein
MTGIEPALSAGSHHGQHPCEDHPFEVFGVSGIAMPETPNTYLILMDIWLNLVMAANSWTETAS